MTTLLILLTPILLLGIVALFGFVGCAFRPGRAAGNYTPIVVTASPRETTLTAKITGLVDNELIVATLQWGGPPTPTPTFTATGLGLYPAPMVNNGKPFSWNGMNIQVFMNNVDNPGDGTVAVKVTLPAPSPVPWSLCIWPYGTLAQNPVFGALSTEPNFVGVEIKTPEPITLNQNDALYAVAYAADAPATTGGNGAFPGTNSLSAPAGWGFLAYNANSNPLLIGFLATGPGTGRLTPLAINKPTDPKSANPKGFMVALGIRSAGDGGWPAA
jgi:hypothetical protein